MNWLKNLSEKLIQITHGRTTAFFIAFFVAGHVMVVLGKMTPAYIGFMGTLGGLVLGHSIQENVLAANIPTPGGQNADTNPRPS